MAAQTISFEPPRQKQMDLEMISINMFTKSFSFPAAHNQKKVIISNEYIKTIIGSIGLDYLIQKLLYLNEHHFNIRPAVDEKQNYYYNLVLPIEYMNQYSLFPGSMCLHAMQTYYGCNLHFKNIGALIFYGESEL